ncbi:hypothetical protein [Lysinibacillus sp. FSL W8-0992]|uniref:hypothetical protein n=1 Tax=Lysinibacillus sp. FSL W8-0992 TaxID=2954643 RepID=UPI0030FB5EBE
MAKNQVIAGDYQQKRVIGANGVIGILLGFGKIVNLDQTTVESYEHKSEDHKKGTHVVSIEFKDGKKSLVEIDGNVYKALLQAMFKTSTSSAPGQGTINSSVPTNNKGCRKGCLIFIVAAIVVIIGTIILVSNMAKNPEKYNTAPKDKITRELNITSEQGGVVIKTLASVGINEDVTIKHDEVLDNAHFEGEKGYRLSNRDASNIILYMNTDGSIYNIRYGDNDLYTKDKVISKLNEYIVTSMEKAQLQTRCEKALKSILKAPSTAKFAGGSDWKIWKENGQTVVQSYVDSQNGFGAMIRSEFQFIIENDNVVSLIMDGKEYMK